MRAPIIKRKTSWFYSPILTVVLLVFVGWGGVGVVKAYFKQREAVSFRDQYAREYRDLQAKDQELEAKIGDLSTDRGMEEEVRNRYRVARPGENLVIVVNNGPAEEPPEKPGFWVRLRAFVGW